MSNLFCQNTGTHFVHQQRPPPCCLLRPLELRRCKKRKKRRSSSSCAFSFNGRSTAMQGAVCALQTIFLDNFEDALFRRIADFPRPSISTCSRGSMSHRFRYWRTGAISTKTQTDNFDCHTPYYAHLLWVRRAPRSMPREFYALSISARMVVHLPYSRSVLFFLHETVCRYFLILPHQCMLVVHLVDMLPP